MAAGGQAHAGHGNYEQWMNPVSLPTRMNHHSLEFKSIVDVFDVNGVKKKALPGRMSSSTILGRPQEQEQSQKMNLGLVDFTFAPEYTSEDEETERDGGIVPQQPRPVQEESPQQISDNQIMTPFPSPASNQETIPQGEINHNVIVSHTLDHPDLEMIDYEHEFVEAGRPNLTVDNFPQAEHERRVSTFANPLTAQDVMNVEPLGDTPTETMVIDEGGDELTQFKPELQVESKRKKVKVQPPYPTFAGGKGKLVKEKVVKDAQVVQRQITRVVAKNPVGELRAKIANVEKVKRYKQAMTPIIPDVDMTQAEALSEIQKGKKRSRGHSEGLVGARAAGHKTKKRKVHREPKTKSDFSAKEAKAIKESMVNLAVKNKLKKTVSEKISKKQTPAERAANTSRELEIARQESVYKNRKEKREKAARKSKAAEKRSKAKGKAPASKGTDPSSSSFNPPKRRGSKAGTSKK